MYLFVFPAKKKKTVLGQYVAICYKRQKPFLHHSCLCQQELTHIGLNIGWTKNALLLTPFFS